jgi:membrane protein DedA with SNARE-associated domain
MFLDELYSTYSEIPAVVHFIILALSAFIENIFPPIPGDVIVVLYAGLSAKGFSLYLLISAVLLGNFLGGSACFLLGDKLLPLFRKLENRSKFLSFLNEDNEIKAANELRMKGHWIIVFSRFLPGIRFFIAIVAGIVKIKPWKFYLSFMIGVVLWNSLLIFAGRILVEDWAAIQEILSKYTVFIISLVIIVSFVIYMLKRKDR